MKSTLQVAGLLLLAACTGLCYQRPVKPPRNAPAAARNPGGRAAAARGGGMARMNIPLNPGLRFLNMTPEEQERVLEKATSQQRERLIQARLRWQSMPPARREFVSRQYQSLSRVPPDQQALLTRQMNAFNKLSDERRGPVRGELIRLLRMPPEQRLARFSSREFTGKYSPEEQQILRDLSTSLPADYPLAGK